MTLTNTAAAKAFEELADSLMHKTHTLEDIMKKGFSLKPEKTFADVRQAAQLEDGQAPGDYERMVAHIENNLRKVVTFTG